MTTLWVLGRVYLVLYARPSVLSARAETTTSLCHVIINNLPTQHTAQSAALRVSTGCLNTANSYNH